MRVTATETTDSVVISFTNSPPDGNQESVAIRHSEVKNLTVEEAVALLHNKLIDLLDIVPEEEQDSDENHYGQRDGDGTFGPKVDPLPKGIVETEIVDTGRSTQVEEFELEGDEDDEDLSLFEVEVDSKW
jgi:hypothetical protein